MNVENFSDFEEMHEISTMNNRFLYDSEELEKADFKDVKIARKIIEMFFLYKNQEDYFFYKNYYKKIMSEVSKHEDKTSVINGMTFIYSNEVEHYFARMFSISGGIGCNKYIDKKIKVVLDDDMHSDKVSFSDEGDIIVCKVGIFFEPEIDKFKLISNNPQVRDAFVREYLLPDVDAFFEDMYEEYPEFANIPQIGKITSSLLKRHEESVTDDLLDDKVEEKAMSVSEVLELFKDFLKTIDKSGHLLNVLNNAINNNDIVFLKTKEEVEAASLDINVDIASYGGLLYNPNGKLYLPCSGTVDDFISLSHEFMHYNSLVSSSDRDKANSFKVFTEFPSIYFEYLAKFFAEKRGIKTNQSIVRNQYALKPFYDVGFFAELSNLYFSGNLNSKSIMELANEYNFSFDRLCTFLTKDLRDVVSHIPYIIGLLATKESIDQGINPDVIRDISTHLYDLPADEIIDKLKLDDLNLSNTEEEIHSR